MMAYIIPYQCGLRPNKLTVGQIFTLSQILENTGKKLIDNNDSNQAKTTLKIGF